jgi:hypothetical protein
MDSMARTSRPEGGLSEDFLVTQLGEAHQPPNLGAIRPFDA